MKAPLLFSARRFLLFAGAILIAKSAVAQLVADGATNTLSNVTNTITGDVTAGTNGSFTLLVLSNNVLLTNSVNGVIGRNATAKTNEVQLISPTARWRMGGSLFIGSNGSMSRLIISNGAFVENFSARLSFAGAAGNQTVSSNNFALITGAGSVWSNRNDLDVGQSGRNNQMIVSNGGRVVSVTASVGENGAASNNLALVTGSGSVWSNAMNLRVGVLGSSNRLVVEAGGRVHAGTGIVGDLSSGSNNQVIVTGPGALWTNASAFIVGNQVGPNELVVSAGGAIWSASGVVGNSFAADNRAVVTGAGSVWNMPGTLTIGDFGSGNQLLVTNGGTVLAGNLFVGANSGSANNRVTVDGGTLRVTNATASAMLDVRRGTNVLTAGLIEADTLLVTNATGHFKFNGGTLSSKSTIATNGVPFDIGNNVSAATFHLAGNGTHLFTGLTVNNLGTLTGNGTVGLPVPNLVVVLDTGTISPGTSIGKIGFTSPLLVFGTTFMEISRNGTVVTNDQIQIAGLTHNGYLTVTNIGPTPLAAGDRFPLFSAPFATNSLLSLTLPPLGAGLSWGSKFAVDGSIEVLGLIVQTLPASVVASNTATLNGSVNPGGQNASAWFEYGFTTNYGNVTAPQAIGNGTVPVNINEVLTGLFGGVYHFRVVASNSFGVLFGSDQNFTLPAFADLGAGLPSSISPAAWGDYDNDGRLDIVLAGLGPDVEPVLSGRVYRNTVTGFTNSAFLPKGKMFGSVAWGDYDNDEQLDVLLTGARGALAYAAPDTSFVLRNTGSGFTNVNAALPILTGSSGQWGDYDNDGRLDILLTGVGINNQLIGQLWRNTGGGFTDVNAGLPGVFSGSAAWGDYDKDGRLDILLAGGTYGSSAVVGLSQILRNTGNEFTNFNPGLSPLAYSSIAWGDYDNDGQLDILLTGTTNASSAYGADPVTQVWRNTGTGFTNINAGLPGVVMGSALWGDYDNDGRLDILLAGGTTALVDFDGFMRGVTNLICQVWRNTGSGFTNVNAGLPGVAYGSAAWGDCDNDGRLDILLAGSTNGLFNGGLSQIWRNQTPLTNTPPTAPTGLRVTTSLSVTNNLGTTVILSWNAASDAQTPAAGLTYNVRIGTTPGASDVMAPMASSSGFRRLPQMGNANERLFARFNAAPATPYYWTVQAVDTAFAGSPFAAEQSFTFNTVLTPTNGIPVPGDQNGDGVVSQSELAAVLANLNGSGILTEDDLNLVLSNYFATSPWLYLTNVAGLGGTHVTFALTNDLTGAFSVEFTTNLVDWYFLGPAMPRYLFTDTNAPAVPQRSYRLRWP